MRAERVGHAQVVFEGVHTLLAMFTEALLRHPRLSDAYFRLLLQLCEMHPRRVGAMPASHFIPLVQSLEWGLTHGDAAVHSCCLSTLSALAAFHHAEALAQRPGLGDSRLPGARRFLHTPNSPACALSHPIRAQMAQRCLRTS